MAHRESPVTEMGQILGGVVPGAGRVRRGPKDDRPPLADG